MLLGTLRKESPKIDYKITTTTTTGIILQQRATLSLAMHSCHTVLRSRGKVDAEVQNTSCIVWSSAILSPRVDHTMNRCYPFCSVVCRSQGCLSFMLVHSVMFPNHEVFGHPLFPLPGRVPWMMPFSRQLCFMTWPKQHNFLFFIHASNDIFRTNSLAF